MRTFKTGLLLLPALLLSLTLSGCTSLLLEAQFGPVDVVLNSSAVQGKYKRIAVVPYDVSGYDGSGPVKDAVSGTALADRYTFELIRAGYDVIERQRLESIIKEQALSMTGLMDPKTSVRVGKVLGVQGFVFGSVSGKPNAFSVMSKLVDAETGSTVWSVVLTNNIEKNAIKALRKELDRYYAKGGK